MDYPISATAINQGDEVLTLWRAFRDAGFTIPQMGAYATTGFEPADLRVYAHTDKMPFRIGGKLYVVSEFAASIVAVSPQHMLEWEKDSSVNARDLCIEVLSYLLGLLRSRRAVSIVCTSTSQWALRISVSEHDFLAADAVAVMICLAAIGLNQFSIQQLLSEKVRLIPR